MSPKKQQDVGRTQWDFLNSLFQNRTAVAWVAAVASLIVVLGIAAILSGYLTLQLNSTQVGESQPRTCADYGFRFRGGEQRTASAKAPFQLQIVGPQLTDPIPWLVSTTQRGPRKSYWGPIRAEFLDGIWTVNVPGDKTGSVGETKYYAIILVGSDGEVLFRAYSTMHYFSPDGNPKWPSYKEKTSDMLECPGLLAVKFN